MGRTVIKFAALLIWSVLIVFLVHRGAIRSELRYSRVAEGNISQSVHAMWSKGWEGYAATLRGDAWWGRIRPLHIPFYNIPYFLTLLRNGDLFQRDAEVPISDRINGDLQTHTFFLLSCFSLAIAALALAIWRVTGFWWPGFLLPLLCVPGNRYLSQNLLVNYCDSGEIGQLLFISMYIGLVVPMFSGVVPGRIREVAASFFLLLAYAMKETTVVILPVVLVLVGWISLGSTPQFKKFAIRHSLCNILFFSALLLAVFAVKSGAYVAQNYAASNLTDNMRRSWEFMTLYSNAVPYVLIGGVFLGAIMIWHFTRKIRVPNEGRAPLILLLLATGVCAGFWAINIPWGQPLDKYYLPTYAFACVAGVLILQISIGFLWHQRLYAASILWLAGSVFFLFRNFSQRYATTLGFYEQNYGHRMAIPNIVADIALHTAGSQIPYRTHIVADHLYQEGPLPFLRWLNRFNKLNVAVNGEVVSTVSGIERNYFRRYEGAPAVALSLSDSVPDDMAVQALYFLSRPDGMRVEQLRIQGYETAEYQPEEGLGTGVWKYTKTN